MRLGRILAVAVAALCLLSPPLLPEASADGQSAIQKRKRRKARRAKQRRIQKRRRLAARKRRAAARKKKANRPKGWQWPPTPAMQAQGRACRKELTGLGVKWKRAGRRKGIATPIVVPSLTFGAVELAPTFRKPPFVMDCHLAVALTKASSAIEKAGVSELRFSSIYSYRKAIVNGKQRDALSRHSYGLAIDVYELRDDLGEIFDVEDQYADEAVIRRLENVLNETGLFRLVLSPDNDPQSHSDHLHLEARVAVPRSKPVKRRRRGKKNARRKARKRRGRR